MIPLLGFTPDALTNTPGILVDCQQWMPSENGGEAAPSAQVYSTAMASSCYGAETLTLLDTTRRVFAGTASKLNELSGTSWTDRSRGGGYTLGAESQWSFAQFGDTSLATNIDTVVQSSSGAAFSDISGAPKAKAITAVLSSGGGFVLAFNTIDGTYGTSPDRWWCCAVNDVTSWTPSVSTQATTGRLLGGQGPILAGVKLGADQVVAYKENSLYVGAYVGPPEVWAFREIPGFGAAGLNAVANLGTVHFVVGRDDLYLFDGARPIPIADRKIRRWFNDNCSGTYRYKTDVRHDKANDRVWVRFVSSGSASSLLDRCLVYHVKTGEWGCVDAECQAALLFAQPSATFDGDSGTFDAATGSFDAVSPGNFLMAYFNTSHQLCTLDGTPGTSSFTLQDIGDNEMVTRLTRAHLQYVTAPTTASMAAFYTMAIGQNQNTGLTESAFDVPADGSNFFPLRQTARWHRLKFNFTGNCKVAAYSAPLQPAGIR